VRHVFEIEFGIVNAVNEKPMPIEQSELHQIADIGAACFPQIFQKALFERESAAGNMGADAQIELFCQFIALADQFLGAHAGSDPVRIRLDDHAKTRKPIKCAVPAAVLLLEGSESLIER